MGVRVGQWTKTIVVFLAGCIPKSKFNVLSINFDIGDIVFEHGGDINLAETKRLEVGRQSGDDLEVARIICSFHLLYVPLGKFLWRTQ
jgi:hypothetical protein